jgi:hypothetical protein
MAEPILVRTTVGLHGLRYGSEIMVDPEEAEIKVLLANQLLVPVNPPQDVSEPENAPDDPSGAEALDEIDMEEPPSSDESRSTPGEPPESPADSR